MPKLADRLKGDLCPFTVGQAVRINPNSPDASEWEGVFIVVGVVWDYRTHDGRMDIWIASEEEIERGLGATTDFRVEDLIPD